MGKIEQEARGEDTREMSRAELEARLERAERAVRRLSWVISGGIGEVESSRESHAELPAFPIEKLKTWLNEGEWTVTGVKRKIADLEAEVKEGK